MIQQTSIISFIELNRNVLSHNQSRVFNALVDMGSATDSELCDYLGEVDKNRVRPRRNELVEYGLIGEDCRRECSITHKTCIAWKVL